VEGISPPYSRELTATHRGERFTVEIIIYTYINISILFINKYKILIHINNIDI
jgi:hypothetical protein